MRKMDWLAFGSRRTLPTMLQTEATECGLACLAMVASYYGHRIDLATLRRRFPISLKGARLSSLIDIADRLDLATRAVRLELEDIRQLRTPCILHWNFQHFVVLKSVGKRSVRVLDPAHGERCVSLKELSDSFTGVALELWPSPEFRAKEDKQIVRLRDLMGHVTGLARSLSQILLLALTLEVFAIVSPFFMQWVIDNVLLSADRGLLTTLALGFGLLMLLQQLITSLRSWMLIYLGATVNIQWRANVFTHMLKLPGDFFEKRHVGDIVSRFSSIDSIQRTLTASFVEGILDGIMTVVTVTMLFIYSPLLAWVSLGAMFLYVVGRWAWYRPLRNATEELIVHTAKQHSHFLETVRGVRTIKLFLRHDERRASWLALLSDQVFADVRAQKLQTLYRLLNGALFGTTNILVVWLGARLVLDGAFSVGMLMAYMSYKGQFVSRVSALIDRMVEFRMLHLHGERLADIVLTEVESLRSGNVRLLLADKEGLHPSIDVRGLRFRYAEHDPFVLDGVSFRVEAGESVAIAGPSGCGKTTLVQLMLGMLSPTEGAIFLGGSNAKVLGAETLRQLIGTVIQDDVLFEGTIAENISFFDPSADQEWIEECARRAAIHEEIASMPMGYNTFVGYMGAGLSGGQRQRVLLARALYKRPKILLLDEATSHLDVQREALVNASIRGLNITRVIVAHRPQTIETADRVIVLEKGRVAEIRQIGAAHQRQHAQEEGITSVIGLATECETGEI